MCISLVFVERAPSTTVLIQVFAFCPPTCHLYFKIPTMMHPQALRTSVLPDAVRISVRVRKWSEPGEPSLHGNAHTQRWALEAPSFSNMPADP